MARMTEELLEQIYALFQQGANYRDICKATGCNQTLASSLITCFKNTSKAEVFDVLVHHKYLTNSYTVGQLSDIVEEMCQEDCGLWQGVIRYRIEYSKLYSLLKLRKELKHKLSVDEIKAQCKWAGPLLRTKKSRTTPVQDDAAVTEQPTSGVFQTQHSTVLNSQDLSDEELLALTDKPRIFGRAVAVPRYYRGKKLNRNKATMEANKQQKRIKQRIADASQASLEAADNSTADAATVAASASKTSGETTNKPKQRKRGDGKNTHFFTGHPAADYLDAEGNFTLAGKRCRWPFVDPSSEGFEKLPAELQIASLKRRLEQVSLEAAAWHLVVDRPRESLSTAERYEVYLGLKNQFPDVKDHKLLVASGLDPQRRDSYASMLDRPDPNAVAKKYILEIYEERQGNVGRVSMALELRKFGIYLCDQTVRKLMKELGLKWDPPKSARYNSYQGEHALMPNLLERDFSASRPLEKLVTDVTMIPCKDAKLYVSLVKDLFTKQVWCSMSDSATTEMVLDSVMPVLEQLKPDLPCIIHSDQGIQYQSVNYQQVLADFGVKQSMSRKGNCYDNGACESMFGVMKTHVHFNKTDTLEVNRAKVLEFCDNYNRKRTQAALKGMSPVQFRMLFESKQAEALASHG